MRRRALRFSVIFVLPHVVFGVAAGFMAASFMIDLINGVLLALACGVCVAYFPVVYNILGFYRRIDRADLLALGIFFAWFGVTLRTVWLLLWRYNDRPIEWVNTHFTGYVLFLSVVGAAFHLLAPGVVNSKVPSGEWVKIGVLCALGIMAILFASWLLDSFPLAPSH